MFYNQHKLCSPTQPKIYDDLFRIYEFIIHHEAYTNISPWSLKILSAKRILHLRSIIGNMMKYYYKLRGERWIRR